MINIKPKDLIYTDAYNNWKTSKAKGFNKILDQLPLILQRSVLDYFGLEKRLEDNKLISGALIFETYAMLEKLNIKNSIAHRTGSSVCAAIRESSDIKLFKKHYGGKPLSMIEAILSECISIIEKNHIYKIEKINTDFIDIKVKQREEFLNGFDQDFFYNDLAANHVCGSLKVFCDLAGFDTTGYSDLVRTPLTHKKAKQFVLRTYFQ